MLHYIDIDYSITDNNHFVEVNAEYKDKEKTFFIPFKVWLDGLIAERFIDSYSEDFKSVIIGLPDVTATEDPNTIGENEGGEITEDAIDVVKETFPEAGNKIFQWWIHQKLYKKL